MKFKDHYDEACARLLAEKFAAVYAPVERRRFVGLIAGRVADKELFERLDVFARALEACLPDDCAETIALFEQILGPPLKGERGMYTEGWWLWPLSRYVERHGSACVARSLQFIRQLTMRFSGEFAIRPILAHDPRAGVSAMVRWSRDPNVHVRRLASEGMRIRLPWAKKQYTALENFADYKTILGNLKADDSRFVQKSVGNNLNDLFKEAPEKAAEIIREWQAEPLPPATLWILRHGTRTVRRTPPLGLPPPRYSYQ
ncbi:MAG: DNA alkylation repair protein [Spirochaetaceae bacterium]|nr:DNA alkylation repair protein [Spirochaetaceae bacterium]